MHSPPTARRQLVEGIACALGAGLLWGLVFVVPLMLPDYPPAMLSFGRYLGFGVIALCLAATDLRRLGELRREDWLMAGELALVGNILYYLFLSAAIQLADAPLPTALIGTLPIVIALVANFGDDALPWRRLLPSLGVIAAGIALLNHHELSQLAAGRSARDYWLGALSGLAAVAAWTWYPVRNSRWLRRRPALASGTWSIAQGLATLPLAIVGMAAAGYYLSAADRFDFPFGPQATRYVGLMLTLGLCASWLGTLLWNRASKLLPTALAGQLIVFETLAAFAYAFIWRGALPGSDALAGIALLIGGVILGVRAFRRADGP
ncbi:DMT family transporter [Accumulibacter sp.]|uniref:DMT family transporter n=1 Tax=Accumulibacter sp. TaxID=2053492 RepID=UPI00262A45ED|nr:DMT family transporter [Accumulibacter sp.]